MLTESPQTEKAGQYIRARPSLAGGVIRLTAGRRTQQEKGGISAIIYPQPTVKLFHVKRNAAPTQNLGRESVDVATCKIPFLAKIVNCFSGVLTPSGRIVGSTRHPMKHQRQSGHVSRQPSNPFGQNGQNGSNGRPSRSRWQVNLRDFHQHLELDDRSKRGSVVDFS